MKQVLQNLKSGSVCIEEVPAPVLRDEGILVRSAVSLVSAGTERMLMKLARKSLLGKARERPDLVRKVLAKLRRDGVWATLATVREKLDREIPLGYSLSGEVIAVGSRAGEFAVGQRVACAGAGYANHAEVNYVPRLLAVPVPDGVSTEAAAYATVGAIALQGIRNAGVQAGEAVVVLGLGLIGQLAVQLLKAAGCRVVGLDVVPSRVEMAAGLGADLALSVEAEGVAGRVWSFTRSRGADAVLITAATSSSRPLELAAQLARDRARVVLVGVTGMQVPRKEYYEKELTFIVSRSYGPGRYDRQYEEHGHDYPPGYVRWTENRNLEAFLDLVAAGRVRPEALTTHRFPIADALAAFEMVLTNRQPYLGVLLTYPQPAERMIEKGVPGVVSMASGGGAGGSASVSGTSEDGSRASAGDSTASAVDAAASGVDSAASAVDAAATAGYAAGSAGDSAASSVDAGALAVHLAAGGRTSGASTVNSPASGVDSAASAAVPTASAPARRIDLAVPGRRPKPGVPALTRPKGTVGVSVLGAGSFTRGVLLPILARLPGVELRGIASASGVSARSAGRKFGFAFCASAEEELLADDRTDAVFIVTPHSQHAAAACRALEAGKAVFVEKPLAINAQQLDAVRQCLQKTAGRLMVGFNRRFAPLAAELKAFLAGRGPMSMTYRVNAGAIPADHWLCDPAEGGRIIGEACHFFDFFAYLTGAVAESLSVETPAGRNQRDELQAVVRYADGSTAHLLYTADGPAGWSKERIEAFGGGRAAVLDDFRRLELIEADGRRRTSRLWRTDKGHAGLVRAWLAQVAGAADADKPAGLPGPVPLPTPATLLETSALTLAAANGRPALKSP